MKENGEHFLNVRQPGMAGINTLVDPHDIKDQECPDMLNTVFDQGVIGVRQGYELLIEKPIGETGEALNLWTARCSDGKEYMIACYFTDPNINNFYVRDDVNNIWIPINGSYAPTFTKNIPFGAQTWDAGYASDRFYFCNGYDYVGRWRMSIGYLSQNTMSSDNFLTLEDASRFNQMQITIAQTVISGNKIPIVQPATVPKGISTSLSLGQMVFYSGSGITGISPGIYYVIPTNGVTGNSVSLAATLADAIAGNILPVSGTPDLGCSLYHVEPITINGVNLLYYSVSGNNLNLTTPVGSVMGKGTSVSTTITSRPGVAKGNIIKRWQSRLITANASPGSEVTMNFSRIAEPEDFVPVSDDIASGGSEVFMDGWGGITHIEDFGEFLLVGKEDVEYRFQFTLNADLSSQISQIVPIISGKGFCPISNLSAVKAMNTIYYPSRLSGFVSLSPLASGVTSSTGVNVISFNINNYVQNNLDVTKSRGIYFKNKVIWSVTSPTSQNFELVYDLVRNAWTRFDSWNSADKTIYGEDIYFISELDGNVYKGLTGYTDNNNAYQSYFLTKLNNFGEPAMPKVLDAFYIEGYMTQSTTLYTDIFYNEKGSLFKSTYKLNIQTPNFWFSGVDMAALGQLPINQGILDSLSPSQLQEFGYFRCYLSVPNNAGVFTLQAKIYSKDANSVWFISGHGANPQLEIVLPPMMRVDPVNDIPQEVVVVNTGPGLLQENGYYILL